MASGPSSEIDGRGAVATVAGLAVAEVFRLKSALELDTFSMLDAVEKERYLSALDMILSCALTCLQTMQESGSLAMSILFG